MNAIVAVNGDWGIGYSGRQSIVLSGDRSHFREATQGGAVIVGRKTFAGYSCPLPGRKNIVLTRNRGFAADGAAIAHTADEAIAEAAGYAPDKVFVIGGGEVYRLLLPLCSRAFVTRIEALPLSDTFFPDLDAEPGWAIAQEYGLLDAASGIAYRICTYSNKNIAAARNGPPAPEHSERNVLKHV